MRPAWAPRKRAAPSAVAKPAKAHKEGKRYGDEPGAETQADVSNRVLRTAADVWNNPEYVQTGVLGQEGFSKLCVALGIEEMSFEACFLNHLFCPRIGDVLIVCSSKSELQRGIEAAG